MTVKEDHNPLTIDPPNANDPTNMDDETQDDEIITNPMEKFRWLEMKVAGGQNNAQQSRKWA